LKRFFIFFIFLLNLSAAKAQENNTQNVAEYLNQNWIEKSKQLSVAQSILVATEAEEIYKNCFYYLNYLNDNDEIYSQHPSIEYLQKLLNEILAKQPELKKDIRLFVSKNPEPDAYVLPEGSIIVNIGIFNFIKNESQLAAVLCQKVFHYKLQHTLKKIKIDSDLKSVQLSSFSSPGIKYAYTNYPKALLAQVDLATTNLLQETRFDATEYLNVLPLICNLKRDSLGTKIIRSVVDVATSNSPGILREVAITPFQKRIDFKKSYQRSVSDEYYNSSGPLNNRNLAIKDGLTTSTFPLKQPIDSTQYIKMAENAAYEIAENYFLRSKYFEGFYESMVLSKKYPESIPAQTLFLKNLYWLCVLKQDSSINNYIKENNFFHVKDIRFLQLAFYNASTDVLHKNLFTVAKNAYTKTPDNEAIALYYALIVELTLGKAYADAPYANFIKSFPQSVYKEFISNKLTAF